MVGVMVRFDLVSRNRMQWLVVALFDRYIVMPHSVRSRLVGCFLGHFHARTTAVALSPLSRGPEVCSFILRTQVAYSREKTI